MRSQARDGWEPQNSGNNGRFRFSETTASKNFERHISHKNKKTYSVQTWPAAEHEDSLELSDINTDVTLPFSTKMGLGTPCQFVHQRKFIICNL